MRVWSEKRKSCEGISAEMWFWVGRALNGLMFLYGLYCWETRLLFWICCLSIAVKPWNSYIFKWPSCLVNKPWMLRGLDWSRIKRGCEHRAHLSACLGSVIECFIIVMFSITTQRLESLFLKEWKIDFFHLISELACICATGKHASLVSENRYFVHENKICFGSLSGIVRAYMWYTSALMIWMKMLMKKA